MDSNIAIPQTDDGELDELMGLISDIVDTPPLYYRTIRDTIQQYVERKVLEGRIDEVMKALKIVNIHSMDRNMTSIINTLATRRDDLAQLTDKEKLNQVERTVDI